MMPNLARRALAVAENLPLPPGSVAGIVLILVLERVRPARLPGPRALHRAVGAAAVGAGCALNVGAVVERRRRTSGTFHLEEPEALVATGAYAVTRHPMYLGWWLIHLGVGLLRGSAWVAATLPPAIALEHVAGSMVEERELSRRFGEQYARYAERVPRYAGIPGRLRRAAPRTSAT